MLCSKSRTAAPASPCARQDGVCLGMSLDYFSHLPLRQIQDGASRDVSGDYISRQALLAAQDGASRDAPGFARTPSPTGPCGGGAA